MSTSQVDVAQASPQNELAEVSVIGTILVNNEALAAARAVVRPEDFFFDRNRFVYRAMIAMASQRKPIDLVTTVEELRRAGKLEAAGGEAYVARLIDGAVPATNVEHHARIVKEKSLRRELIYAADYVKQQAYEADDPIEVVASRAAGVFSALRRAGPGGWRDLFESGEELRSAPPLEFVITDFMQTGGATIVAGLSGHGKTWLLLSIAKALLSGPDYKLWGEFKVLKPVPRVLYLIPESAAGPFAHRLRVMDLMRYVDEDRLLVRTLSKGPAPQLSDPRLLEAAEGAAVLLDTAIRFASGDENSAGDNQRGLATGIFGLLTAGALCVGAAHHSPKELKKLFRTESQRVMTLENMLRGSGDIGAVLAAAWGVYQVNEDQNVLHLECLKGRDFKSPQPFQLIGRPTIEEQGDFMMWKPPGICGRIAQEYQPGRDEVDRGGARQEARDARQKNIDTLAGWLEEQPDLTSARIVAKFAERGVVISEVTARKYRGEVKDKRDE